MQPPLLEQLLAALGPALALAAASASLGRLLGLGRLPRALLAAAGAACLAVPAGGLPLYARLRGVVGEPSVVTLAALAAAAWLAVRGGSFLSRGDLSALAAAAAVSALALYPSAAGAVPWNLYRAGYRPLSLAVCVLAFSVWAWRAGRRGAAFAALAALAAFDLGALESENLWDYLIDPAGALCASGWWLWRAARAAARRAHRPYAAPAPLRFPEKR